MAQVPSLLSKPQDMSQQVFGQPRVLMITAAVLALIGFVPGMSNLVCLLLALAGCCFCRLAC